MEQFPPFGEEEGFIYYSSKSSLCGQLTLKTSSLEDRSLWHSLCQQQERQESPNSKGLSLQPKRLQCAKSQSLWTRVLDVKTKSPDLTSLRTYQGWTLRPVRVVVPGLRDTGVFGLELQKLMKHKQ
jgi:hypothetical protein